MFVGTLEGIWLPWRVLELRLPMALAALAFVPQVALSILSVPPHSGPASEVFPVG